jgi:hypothetical protein
MGEEQEDRHKPLEDTAANLFKSPRENTVGCRHAHYIGVTLLNHVGQTAAQIFCWLSIVLNEGKGLFIIKDLTLYKQLFVSVTDSACPVCICATRTHVGKTQVVEERDLEFERSNFLRC